MAYDDASIELAIPADGSPPNRALTQALLKELTGGTDGHVLTAQADGSAAYEAIAAGGNDGVTPLGEVRFIGSTFDGVATTINATNNSLSFDNILAQAASIATGGSGWTTPPFTFTFTGDYPANLGFCFFNNSSHPITLTGTKLNTPNGGATAFDLPSGFAAFFASENDVANEGKIVSVQPTSYYPRVVTSTATPFVLAEDLSVDARVRIRSHTTTVDFEVPLSARAGTQWTVYADHAGCTVSVNTDVGSVNGTAGGAVELVDSGLAVIDVESNAGSAPVVTVGGNIFEPIPDQGLATITKDDHDKVLSPTGTQTFGAASTFPLGFTISFVKEDAGAISLTGPEATYTLTGPGGATVYRAGAALLAIGSDGVTVLDDGV